jgi:hypothetical protein
VNSYVSNLITGLAICFAVGAFDHYYYKPKWEASAAKAEQLKHQTTTAQMGYGEYRLDKYTGYSQFVWFGVSEIVHQRYPWLSDTDLMKLQDPYFRRDYEIRERGEG